MQSEPLDTDLVSGSMPLSLRAVLIKLLPLGGLFHFLGMAGFN